MGGEIHSDGNYLIENIPIGNAIVVVLPAAEGDQAAQHLSIKNEKGKAAEPKPKAAFPEKYSDMVTSDLRHKIVAGDNKFDVDLK